MPDPRFTSGALDAPDRQFGWPAEGLLYGGDYNPEQWPPELWDDDIALMQQAGVNLVSLGIFSWGLVEVADDQWDFGWLDAIMDKLHAGGIGVNLATPTAAPPSWLFRAHPEIAPVTADGVRLGQGSRLGWSPSSAVFRRYALRVVEKLATRYGDHPGLRMWHVSNELGNENAHDYGAETEQSFQRWLEQRYGSVEALNEAWGTAFWGHHYTGFDQIAPPRRTGSQHNPALRLDFERFSSDALLDHYRAERDILRRLTPDIPITTNFMVQRHPGVADYARWAREVDLVANDHYTVAVDPDREYELAFCADRVRGMSGGRPWLLMEHSTSAVNWQPRNRAKEPGELIRNSLAHVAHGADGAMFFQWRQSRSGSEQHHSAMVPHAGPESKIFRETVQLGRILQDIGAVRGSVVEPARIAMLFDHDSANAIRLGTMPSADLNAVPVARLIHAALVRRGFAVDVIESRDDLDGYDLIIVPTLYLISDAAAARIADRAAAGAQVLITAFSGIVDPVCRIRLGGHPGAFTDLLGVRMEEFFPLQAGERLRLENGWTGEVWSELGEVTDAEVITRYADGVLAGRPAVTRRTTGLGSATYVSTWLTDDEQWAELLLPLLTGAGIEPVVAGDDGVERTRRTATDGSGRSWLFVLNHRDTVGTVQAHGRDLVTGAEVDGTVDVEPGGVAVIEENQAGRLADSAP